MQTNPIEQNNSGSLNAILMNRKQNDFISRAIKKNTFSDDESDNQSIIEDDDDEENQLVVTTGKAIINEPVDVPKLTIAESDKESRRLPNDLLAAIVARSAFIITSNDNLASGDKHDAEQEQTDTSQLPRSSNRLLPAHLRIHLHNPPLSLERCAINWMRC